METKAKSARPASSGAENFNQNSPADLVGSPAEINYLPKKMTPRETVIVSLKLALIAGLVLALLWLAHVMFDK